LTDSRWWAIPPRKPGKAAIELPLSDNLFGSNFPYLMLSVGYYAEHYKDRCKQFYNRHQPFSACREGGIDFVKSTNLRMLNMKEFFGLVFSFNRIRRVPCSANLVAVGHRFIKQNIVPSCLVAKLV